MPKHYGGYGYDLKPAIDPVGSVQPFVVGSADAAARKATQEIKILNKVNCLEDQPECFASHMGVYAIEPNVMQQLASLILSGQYKAAANPVSGRNDASIDELLRVENGVAMISLNGPMMKGSSKFGGASTQFARRQLAAAMDREDVRGIFFNIDSPGGSVKGTQQLADDIRAAGKVKPVHAHFQDVGASAALWVGAQANTVSVNRSGSVGSIGVYAVVEDTSKKAQREGVKVHVISSGNNKGRGAPGTEITKADLSDMQKTIDSMNVQFVEAIVEGRGMKLGDVLRIADGRMFEAKAALANGLVDFVMSDTEAFAKMVAGEIGQKKSNKGIDNRQNDTDNLTVQDTVDKDTDTPTEANMNLEQIKAFLETDEDGKALLASLVTSGVDAKIESGDLVAKVDLETAVAAAVEGVTAKAAEETAIDEQARAVFAINKTVPLAIVREKLAAVSGEVRTERFERLKAEAGMLAGKNAKAPEDKTVQASNDEKFEKYWASQKRIAVTDLKAKAKAREHYLAQLSGV